MLLIISELLLSLITIGISPAATSLFSADTIITGAADLLEHTDLLINHEDNDPLLQQIQESEHHHHHHTDLNNNHPDEKFLIPLLSDYVGLNNQLMEYMTAAVVAKSTHRSLCLVPFFIGPPKHAEIKSHSQNSLAFESHYDVNHLSQFVNISNMQKCMGVCSKRWKISLFLRGARGHYNHRWVKNTISKNLDWSFVNWTSTSDIARDLSFLDKDQCLGLGGLFPGLRWRGAYLAATEYTHPTSQILDAATAIQENTFGTNKSFLAVHWRFEESNCQGHVLGLCFIRCSDGSIIDSGLHPAARDWVVKMRLRCPSGLRGVAVEAEDIISAISDKAKRDKLEMVYLATDGWIRGKEAQDLLKKVVNDLRSSAFEVVGLWKVNGLPNFSNGRYFDFSTLNAVGSNYLSLIEQEICRRATAFLGSGESTWSLSVFRSRLAKRRSEEMRKLELGDEKRVMERLLKDKHAAGMQCRYEAFFKRVKVNASVETYEDEAPDGWLDLEACEKRIGTGGKCTVAACF